MEKKKFNLHKAALYSIMVAQAGTLEKALLELVMNGVDAGATKIEITLSNTSFSVSDDGSGFAGEYEIEHYFGTFGTPHVEGDAPYGKFRMGRGQIMAFTRNTWRSNDFRMSVNIKEDGDHYGFEKGLPQHKGCHIEGTLYEPLSTVERLTVERHLNEMTKYVSIEVIVNGNKTSQRQTEEKWTFEDDNAYYLLTPNRDRLAIFNLGVLVKETWGSDFGMGGVILSKRQLTVNMARNDLLTSQCPVWKDIAKAARAYVATINKTKKVIKNETWRQMTARKVLAGAYEPGEDAADILSENLFTLINGKHVSLDDLAKLALDRFNPGARPRPICVAPSEGDVRADKAHNAGFAVVLSPRVCSRFGVYTLDGIFREISKSLRLKHFSGQWPQTRFDDMQYVLGALAQQSRTADVLQGFEGNFATTVPDKDLKPEQRMMLSVLRNHQWFLLRGITSSAGARLDPRELFAGKSEGDAAWTDGTSKIWINVKKLTFPAHNFHNLIAYATKMATLLVHEYMHGDDDQQTSVHGTEFYEGFERAVCLNGDIGYFAASVAEGWLAARVKLQKASPGKAVLKRSEAKMIEVLESMGGRVEDAGNDNAVGENDVATSPALGAVERDVHLESQAA